MNVGITGTRFGATAGQLYFVEHLLSGWKDLFPPLFIGHGDCIGVDEQLHDMAVRLGVQTAVFPPDKDDVRAWKMGDIMHAPDGYLARDRAIVEWCDVLIGLPGTESETPRSGTWYTIRYGLKEQLKRDSYLYINENPGKISMDVSVVLPNGTMRANESVKSLLLDGNWG